MKITFAPMALAASLFLHGCMFVPGQHLAKSDLARGDSLNASEVELIPITPKLLAMDKASAEVSAIPVALLAYEPPPYHIGAGDTLFITVWEHPELTAPAGAQQPTLANGRLVRSDGTLFYPYVGVLKVEGLTIEQLREIISEKLSVTVQRPQVDVAVGGFGSQRVSLLGAFSNAAPQPITPIPLTLMQAVGTAGIVVPEANLSGFTLTRDGHDYVLDINTLKNAVGAVQDIYLKSGDRLYLPYNDNQEIYVVGEVARPTVITFKTHDLTLTQALGRAGGLDPTTSKGKAVYVIRGVKNLEQAPSQVFQLDARSPVAFALADQFKVKAGDLVFVGPAGVTRWSRFVSQLLPFSGLINSNLNTRTSLQQN